MKSEKILSSFKQKIRTVFYTGVINEKDDSKEKYIVLLNMISFVSFSVLLLTGLIIMSFTGNLFGGLLSCITGVIILFSVYLNKTGNYFAAKIFLVLITNIAVMVFFCLFEHNTMFASYHFSIITTSYFIFSYKERTWLFVSILISLSLYVLASSELLSFIPFAFSVKDPEKTKLIVLVSHVLMIFLDLFAFLKITKTREDKLVNTQKQILKSESKLKVQNEDLETFSTAASHSLQTPIYIAKFFLEKINNDHPLLNSSVGQHIDIINNCLDQMDQLVSGLFSYNQIVNIDEYYTSFNVRHELESLKKRMQGKFTNCRINFPAEDFTLKTNRLLFSIVIQNLIDNGLKYNNSAIPVVTLSYEFNEPFFSIIVCDNGIGIEKKYFEKIFEPFKRINPGDQYKGNGLGLTGTKRAAERIGGKVTCKDSSDKGSLFQFDIPYNF